MTQLDLFFLTNRLNRLADLSEKKAALTSEGASTSTSSFKPQPEKSQTEIS